MPHGAEHATNATVRGGLAAFRPMHTAEHGRSRMVAIAAAPFDAACAPAMGYPAAMNDRIDEAVLALLYLGIFERHPVTGARTWKTFDWAAMARLHDAGLISDPVGKAKSVALTDTGLRQAEAAYRRLFETKDQGACDAAAAAPPGAPRP